MPLTFAKAPASGLFPYVGASGQAGGCWAAAMPQERTKHPIARTIRILIIRSLIAANTICLTAQTTTPGQSSEALSAALLSQERAWTEAFKNRDRNVLNEVLADDFVFTDGEGNLYDKAKYIAAVMDVIQVTSYTADDMTVRVYGDSAVVVGRWTGTMSIDGKDASGAFRFTDTLVRRDGRCNG